MLIVWGEDAYREFTHKFDLILRSLSELTEKVGIIMAQNEAIQQEVDDLNASVAVIAAGVGTLSTDLDTARQRIAELEANEAALIAAGVSPEVVANLKAAVDGAQNIASAFQAAVDPEQPTPPVEELPDPVTPETPAEEPSVEEPVDPVAEDDDDEEF